MNAHPTIETKSICLYVLEETTTSPVEETSPPDAVLELFEVELELREQKSGNRLASLDHFQPTVGIPGDSSGHYSRPRVNIEFKNHRCYIGIIVILSHRLQRIISNCNFGFRTARPYLASYFSPALSRTLVAPSRPHDSSKQGLSSLFPPATSSRLSEGVRHSTARSGRHVPQNNSFNKPGETILPLVLNVLQTEVGRSMSTKNPRKPGHSFPWYPHGQF